MALFAAAIISFALILLIAIRQMRFLKPRGRSFDEIIPLVSSRARLDQLEHLFHPSFDSE
jgi:hypothetical protein